MWSITELGERMTPEEVDQVPAVVRRRCPGRKRQRVDADTTEAEEQVEQDAPPPEESWKDRLLGVLRQMTPDAFERLAQRLLREAGFIKVEATGRRRKLRVCRLIRRAYGRDKGTQAGTLGGAGGFPRCRRSGGPSGGLAGPISQETP